MPIWYLNPKLWAGMALSAALVWFGFWLHGTGYDSALADAHKLQQAREVVMAEGFVNAVAENQRRRDAALAEVDALRNRQPVIITKEVERIVKENNCNNFSPDLLRLLNATGGPSVSHG